MNNTLISHYDKKYSHEKSKSFIEAIEINEYPKSRFEAAVSYIPQFFKGGDILEIGSGNGSVAKTLLLSDLKINSYTLGEISSSRLDGVKRNLNDQRVNVREIDAENISQTENGTYDAVIMIALIEHLVDPLGAMQRIHELLKPGGFVYIDTPNISKYSRRIKLALGQFPSTASKNEGLTTYAGEPVDLHDEGHLHYFTYRSLSQMLVHRCKFSKTVKLAYSTGNRSAVFQKMNCRIARLWPEMFSELALVAYR